MDRREDQSAAAREAVGTAFRFWWVSALRGCMALLLGVGALISGVSQPALVNFIALYWLLSGIATSSWAVGVRWREGSRLGLTAGVLAIVSGVVLLARDALDHIVTPETLIGGVAVVTVITGCLRLVGAFEIEERTGHRWTVGGVILGSVEVCLGTVLFLVRDAHASTVRITIGVWGLVAGVLLLAQGARMRRFRRDVALRDADGLERA